MRTKLKTLKTVFFWLMLLFLIPILQSQDGRLIGLVDNNLAEINPIDGSPTQIISTTSSNEIIANLAYSTSDCLFYGIKDGSTNPVLISIDWNGTYTEIGSLTIPSGTIFLCEGLAYNSIDHELYGSVSLNGGVPNNDYSSESIVKINPSNGTCTLISQLAPNSTAHTDIDDMVFIDNVLYIHDGTPGSLSEFLKIDFQGLGAVANPVFLVSDTYIQNRDMGAIGKNLYITITDLGFYTIDTDNNTLSYIGQSHTTSEFNGQPIVGLDFVPNNNIPLLNVDTTLCLGETLDLSIDWNDATIIWNTGDVNNSISINSPGLYWAEVYAENCYYNSDTALVNYQECDTCQVLYNQIVDELNLGQDTTLCELEGLELSINPSIGATVIWNTNEIGNSISTNQEGIYWANINYENCNWTSDSIKISWVNCLPCEYFIPNAFSPNDDGYNDKFKVYFDETTCDLISIEMSIFDRWGEVLTVTNNNEWDGYFKDKVMGTGVYVYLIKLVVNRNGELVQIMESGDVSILK